MTKQYLEENINGQPSPLSLSANPTVVPAAGTTSTDAIFWPSLAADAVIVGEGLSVAGSAADGTIIEVSEPGLYQVLLTLVDSMGPNPINILRGVTAPAITAGFGYPAVDYATGLPLGLESLGFTPAAGPPENNTIEAVFRITGSYLVDPVGGVNPNRQIRFSAPSALIAGLAEAGTFIEVVRTSL